MFVIAISFFLAIVTALLDCYNHYPKKSQRSKYNFWYNPVRVRGGLILGLVLFLLVYAFALDIVFGSICCLLLLLIDYKLFRNIRTLKKSDN